MTKVYVVVTSGFDWHEVVAAFSTREKAEECERALKHGPDNEPRIEELELDVPPKEPK